MNIKKISRKLMFSVFFFQAEDGIRDYKVTGVQTCALPIYGHFLASALFADRLANKGGDGRRKIKAARKPLGARTHFSPGLPEDIDEFCAGILRMLRGKGLDLALQEDEHGSVLQGLGAGIGPEPVL